MNQELIITDLTRMSAGFVCAAGYAANGQPIRLAAPRLHEVDIAAAGGQPIVFPGAIIACDLLEHLPDPPHTEDHRFDRYSLRLVRRLQGADWQTTLDRSLFGSVRDIFEQPIVHDAGYYIQDGNGARSIGTIKPRGLAQATYSVGEDGTWTYRFGFYDRAGQFYRLKITDLTWNAYCESLRGPDTHPQDIAARLTQLLKSRRVYLRVGLARKWAKFPGRCYLQVNGVYTFPDYLDGLTFADLRPNPAF
jgi:hypothetical protein